MIPIVRVSFSELGLTGTHQIEYASKREDASRYHRQEATPGSSTHYWQEAPWSRTDYPFYAPSQPSRGQDNPRYMREQPYHEESREYRPMGSVQEPREHARAEWSRNSTMNQNTTSSARGWGATEPW